MTQRSAHEPPAIDLRAGHALFLDVDGTLLEIAAAPDRVVVTRRLLDLLGELIDATGGACALVSGRSIAQLDALFAPLTLTCAGLHGLERRDSSGVLHRPAVNDERLERARGFLAALVEVNPGLLLENKHATLAVHYRQAPQLEAVARRMVQQALQMLGSDYCVLDGKMVLELKPDGFSKSMAIAAFLREPPFEERAPVFIGDDQTDEAGLHYVENLGGLAIHVGPEHANSHARWRLPDPRAVLAWLEATLGARPTAVAR